MSITVSWTARGGDPQTITEQPADGLTVAQYVALVAEANDVPGNDFYLVQDHTDGIEVDPKTKLDDLTGKFTMHPSTAKVTGAPAASEEITNARGVPSNKDDILAWVNAADTPEGVVDRANDALKEEDANYNPPRPEVVAALEEVVGHGTGVPQ